MPEIRTRLHPSLLVQNATRFGMSDTANAIYAGDSMCADLHRFLSSPGLTIYGEVPEFASHQVSFLGYDIMGAGSTNVPMIHIEIIFLLTDAYQLTNKYLNDVCRFLAGEFEKRFSQVHIKTKAYFGNVGGFSELNPPKR